MSRYTRPALSPEELAAGRAEARKQVRKRLRHGYCAWNEIRRPDGLYHCACRKGCKQGVFRYGDVSFKCEGEYEASRKNRAADVLARMRAKNAGKKPRAA